MSKIQINDVKLDGAELFNDSETFLDELKDSEMEQIFGGLSKLPPDEYARSVYIPQEPFHPQEPVHPERPVLHPPRKWKPIHPPLTPPIPFPFPLPHEPWTPVML